MKDPLWMQTALGVLRAGGLIAFPTDTVYGVGAPAFDGEAIKRIFRAKGRPAEKSIPILVAGWKDAGAVVTPNRFAEELASVFWPGPVTLVVRRKETVPQAIGPGDTVGVRAPDHPVALELLHSTGPLATTSANRSGEASSRTAAEVASSLGGRIAIILDGGVCPGGSPSTVIDCTGPEPVLLRQGPISIKNVLAAWPRSH